MTYAETGLTAAIEQLTGTSLSALPREQLDGIDQYHAGGAEAVDRLIPHLALTPGSTVLDVGSGLGGPARQIARTTGCHVVGVDITPAYVDAARALTEAAGLAERTTFLCTDIGALDRTGFDAACTVHVQMNIPDKKAFYAEIARRLRPAARLAVFEVCGVPAATAPLPLPWSLDGTDSHLATPEELRDTIRAAGFDLLDWTDETPWARAWFDALGRRLAAGSAAPALPSLLTDGPTRMLNFAIALATGAVTVHRGTFAVPT
ncbi:SAM-dependent methyltransferase [Actinacidiphila paucisporea]|uniref:Methyltransferase domain-containing protein n=1 Tax=Actinacidiphila paucisporea TaxID=310782 RepID=A0A1M7K4P8_9ACTN|nr:methyltransferase domain-containing protein [Actinacidiphila paucisporea]SHM60260.1 Methyltransferase domain-containing protein [Actinacidiphila paucisporea]